MIWFHCLLSSQLVTVSPFSHVCFEEVPSLDAPSGFPPPPRPCDSFLETFESGR